MLVSGRAPVSASNADGLARKTSSSPSDISPVACHFTVGGRSKGGGGVSGGGVTAVGLLGGVCEP